MAFNSLRTQHLKGKFKMALFGTISRTVWNHPFIVAMLLFLVCLHRYFPFLFYLLVSASPVLVCTAVLLGTLLIYGQPNDRRVENHGKMSDPVVPPRSTILAEHKYFADKDGMFPKDRFAEVRKDIVEKGMKVSGVTNGGIRAFNDMHKDVDRGYRNLELNQENKFHNARSKVEFCFGNTEDKDVHTFNVQSPNQVERYSKLSQLHDDTSTRDHSDSSLPSLDQQKHVDDDVCHESVDSESDAAEKSSLDALVANVILTAQETLPLLDSEEPQHTSHDVSPNSEAQSLKSNQSSGDSEEEIDEDEYENETPEAKTGGDNSTISWTDEDQKILLELKSSEVEKNEHLESLLARISDEREKEEEALGVGASEDIDVDDDEDDDDDDEEEGPINVAKEHVTMWTEEDEKNLSYLGSSELERNQRLENLLMRRRAQRNFSMIDERNLIDLDRPDHLPFQVAPISTTKVVNPFDSTPNDENQNSSIPPIPGSAPSITLPRKNLFDSPNTSPKGTPDRLTTDHLNEESMEANLNDPLSHTNASSNMGFNPILKEDFVETQKEAVFRRYDSFSTGFNFMGEGPRYEFPEIDRKDMIFSRHESFRPRSPFPSIFTTEIPEAFHFKPVFVPEQLAEEEATHPHLERQSSQSSESSSNSESETESVTAPVSHEDERIDQETKSTTKVLDNVDSHSDNENESSDTVDSQHNDQHEDSTSNLEEKVDNDQQKTEAANENHDTASSSSVSSEEDHRSPNTGHNEGNKVVESSLSPMASPEVSNVNHVSSDDEHTHIEPVYEDHTHVEPVYDTSPSGVEKNIPFSPAAEI